MNVAESPARVRGVFFDLDGTLADTVAALTATLNEIFLRRGYPLVTEADTLRCINYGARELVRRASPATCTDLEIDELFDEYLECYRAHNLDTRRAYDGIVELIAELRSRGVCCAVVTNKPHPMACELVESLLGGALDAVLGQSPDLPAKPDAAMAREVLGRLGLSPDETVYVGDSTVDVAFAHNSGMRFVGAGWGFFGKDKLVESGARDVADHPLEILEYLK